MVPGEATRTSWAAAASSSRRSTWSGPDCGSSTGTGGAQTASSTSWPSSGGSWWCARSRPARACGTAARSRRSARVSALRLRRLAAAWLAAQGLGFERSASTWSGCSGRSRGSSPSSTSGGGLDGGRPDPLDRPGRGRGPSGRDRGRYPERAARGCSWSACPIRRCARPGTGSGPPSSTAASSGRSGGSPSVSPRRACPSAAAGSTLASRWPCSAAAGSVPAGGARRDGVPRRARARRPAAPGPRGAARCRGRGGPRLPARSRCRAPTRPRRRWSPACGCWALDPAGAAQLVAWLPAGPPGGTRRRAEPRPAGRGRWPCPARTGAFRR